MTLLAGPRTAPRQSDGIMGTAAIGMAVLVVFLALIAGWAAHTMIAGAVVVPGVVKVISDRQPVKHQESGIVSEVAVVEGQEVQAGQLLFKLDATQARALTDQLGGQMDKLMAEEARLVAERDRRDVIAYPQALLDRAGEEPAIREIMATEQSLFASRRTALEGQIALLRQTIQQQEEQVTGHLAEVKSLERQNQLIQQETEDTRYLFNKGYAQKSKLLALERSGAALIGQRDSIVASIAETRKTIEQSRMRMDQLVHDRLAEVNDQLSKTRASLSDTEPRLRAARRQLQLTEIRAPMAGRVMALAVRAPGRVIQPSDVLMELVPSDQPLVIQGTIRPEDVDDVAVGMPAEIKLTGLNRRLAPRLPGRVVDVSADRMTDQHSGAAYYEVRLEVDDSALADSQKLFGHQVSLAPGMPAQIAITTRERTVLDYLISPLADGLEKALREP